MYFKDNIPVTEQGLDNIKAVCFSGGRVSADMASHGGLFNIRYFGKQRFCGTNIFQADPLSCWVELLRLYAVINGDVYYLETNDTEIFPYGYRSRCKAAGIKMEHELILLNDSLRFRIKITDNPNNSEVKIRLVINETCARVSPSFRNWSDFSFFAGKNLLSVVVTDTYAPDEKGKEDPVALAQQKGFYNRQTDSARIFVGITADQPLEFVTTPKTFKRHQLTTVSNIETVIFTIQFADSESAFESKMKLVSAHAGQQCDAFLTGWAADRERQTTISCRDRTVQSMLANVMGVIDSLKVKDLPGGMRAADSGYWIWGWDSMVYADALLLGGDHEFVLEMLEFYCQTAHRELGIFHAMTLDMTPHLAMAPAAQTLYCITLYFYYIHTRNREVLDKYFGFAATVITRAERDEVKDSGLLEGVGLYPDYPEDLDQTGRDISIFNNSIYYQALRAMAVLARISGRDETSEIYMRKAENCRLGIFKYLYDADKGYFYDSVSSIDFTPREHYPVYAVLWISRFAKELVKEQAAEIADFMVDNFPARHGCRILPKWDKGFMKDGNQLGMYMPVVERFFREMMLSSGRIEHLRSWFETVTWFWNQNVFPESLTCRAENHQLTVDNPGRKQGFAAKSWYSIFCEVICGIHISENGIEISPSPLADGVDISNLRFADKTLAIAYLKSEKGQRGQLVLNGTVCGSHHIDYGSLEQENEICCYV